MDCLTQTRSVVRSRGLSGVARIPEAAAAVEGTAVAVAAAVAAVVVAAAAYQIPPQVPGQKTQPNE